MATTRKPDPVNRTVLLVNKFLYPRAGAETAYLHTRDLLQDHGHRVLDFGMADPSNFDSEQAPYFPPSRSYDKVGRPVTRMRHAAAAVYSLTARNALRRLLNYERPDVAHLHNIYHQLTLSIVDELHSHGVPIVQTLHDYKIACPAYTLFTEGAPCRRCLESGVGNAVRHRCIKGSVAASGLAALEAAIAKKRGTYQQISRFIAPSRFTAGIAEAAGIPSHRIEYVPYFLPDAEFSTPDRRARPDPSFFFGGRLEETKGVRQVLEAFSRVSVPATLRIAGWGDLEDTVVKASAGSDRIHFLGTLPRERVLDELSVSRAMLLPSAWEDNCPLIMLEAQARGTAVIASARGGPPEFVRDGMDGIVVDPDDIPALAEAISRLATDRGAAEEMGRNGRARVVAHHQARDHYAALMRVYTGAAADVSD